MKRIFALITFLILFSGLLTGTVAAQETAPLPIVQAVLFYSPTCPHCHEVMTNVLPPLATRYGDQLQILGIDISNPSGNTIYQNTIEAFQIADGRRGVPTLIVGQTILVGSDEIPAQLPGLIEAGLAAGGVGWPAVPGLKEAVPDLPPSADLALAAESGPDTAVEDNTTANATQTGTLSLEEIETDGAAASGRAAPADPVGLAVGWVVFLGMLASLVYGLWRSIKTSDTIPERLADPEARLITGPAVPILVVAGLVIALYLTYVEVNQVTAVCGPIGECNLVQSSQYAEIVGIPVAILGVVNYLTLGLIWLFQKPLNAKYHNLGVLGMLVLTLLGTLFSIYLTLLELLVIDAVCAWCLTSAIVTTSLFIIVVHTLTKRPSSIQPGLSAGV